MKLLNNIDKAYTLLAEGPPATVAEVNSLCGHFGSVPQEYLELTLKATEIELLHKGGQYVRIWGPLGCIDMDDGYGIRKRISDAVPIGDDGGGQVIFYTCGRQGFGLYHVGYGNLDRDDAIWIAPSLDSLLSQCDGIDKF